MLQSPIASGELATRHRLVATGGGNVGSRVRPPIGRVTTRWRAVISLHWKSRGKKQQTSYPPRGIYDATFRSWGPPVVPRQQRCRTDQAGLDGDARIDAVYGGTQL